MIHGAGKRPWMDEPEASRGSLHFADVVMEAQRGELHVGHGMSRGQLDTPTLGPALLS